MVNDTISDMLTRIRNANLASQKEVAVSKTKIHEKICKILEREGFIEAFSPSSDDPNFLLVHLKYQKSSFQGPGGLAKPCITNLKRISKPGLRIYTTARDIPRVLGGMGIVILSTSKGILTDREARSSKVGGEVLCWIW